MFDQYYRYLDRSPVVGGGDSYLPYLYGPNILFLTAYCHFFNGLKSVATILAGATLLFNYTHTKHYRTIKKPPVCREAFVYRDIKLCV